MVWFRAHFDVEGCHYTQIVTTSTQVVLDVHVVQDAQSRNTFAQTNKRYAVLRGKALFIVPHGVNFAPSINRVGGEE